MKKKSTIHIIVFIVYAVLVVFGITKAMIGDIGHSGIALLAKLRHGTFTEATVKTFINAVDSSASEDLRYHDQLMDLNSVKDRTLNTRIIKKDNTTIIKSNSDFLVYPVEKVEQKEIDELVSKVGALKHVSEENGAGFLYIAAPCKEYFTQEPEYIDNYSVNNWEVFVQSLKKNNIPTLDLSKTIELMFSNGEDAYFATDHHWKPYSAFLANQAICQELHDLYDMPVDEDKLVIDQYNVQIYKDWFLGSQGKKVGTYFTSQGADDFELITPKFDTELSEDQPFKDELREGNFEETILYLDNLKKDYYHKNPYSVYCGGDSRLQIIKNKLNTEGKKILIIRDSFASVVVPFLSFQASETHVVDIRNYDYYVGDRLNVSQYIEEYKPDYVLVLYSVTTNLAGRFDFE